MSADSASDVSGPVASTTGPSSFAGMRVTSSRRTVTSGCELMRCRHLGGEPFAVHRQRRTSGHARDVGRAHDERPEPPHLFFQKTDSVIELVTAEGVAADQFGEAVGVVHGCRPHRPHLVQHH